jgi:cytochrome b6-f complex iron-sulfur subunit
MNDNLCAENPHEASCSGRRQFLVKATATAGGLVLSVSGARAQDKAMPAKQDAPAASDEFILKLSADSPLNKVGGAQTVTTSAGKVIVARTGESVFVAFSARCTHSGGPLSYDAKAQQFACPWHGSKFDASGQVVNGPARNPLKPFTTQPAVVINAKTS